MKILTKTEFNALDTEAKLDYLHHLPPKSGIKPAVLLWGKANDGISEFNTYANLIQSFNGFLPVYNMDEFVNDDSLIYYNNRIENVTLLPEGVKAEIVQKVKYDICHGQLANCSTITMYENELTFDLNNDEVIVHFKKPNDLITFKNNHLLNGDCNYLISFSPYQNLVLYSEKNKDLTTIYVSDELLFAFATKQSLTGNDLDIFQHEIASFDDLLIYLDDYLYTSTLNSKLEKSIQNYENNTTFLDLLKNSNFSQTKVNYQTLKQKIADFKENYEQEESHELHI